MKFITIIVATFVIYPLCAQNFSGEAKAISFKFGVGPNIVGYTNAVSMKIRQDETFSSTSQPIRFSVGKPTDNKSETSIRTISTVATQSNEAIPEYEISIPKYYSLIIGINDYQFDNSNLRDLSKAVDDATTLYQTLTTTFTFQRENSTLLLNASRKEILHNLETLASVITPKDNLLIFYAGHGVWDEKIKVGYWLPSDSKPDDKSNWISNSTIRDYIAGIPSKHTLLITDACFSGSIFKTRDANLSDVAMSSLYRLPSRKAMTSGTLSIVPDESKFMHYFIKRLLDTAGKYISTRQLFFGLETAVLNNTNTVPQFGVIQDTGDEGGEFIFIRHDKK